MDRTARPAPPAALSAAMSAALSAGLVLLALSAAAPARAAPDQASARHLIGTDTPVLRLAVGERTRLVYQPPQPEAGANPLAQRRQQLGLTEPHENVHALGLEFKRPAREGDPRNLLRVQLSGGSVLHFRPRSGGLHVRWQMTY